MDGFLCFGLVENWKANGMFNTLADKIVKHCVVKKKKSDLLIEKLLGVHGSQTQEVLVMQT